MTDDRNAARVSSHPGDAFNQISAHDLPYLDKEAINARAPVVMPYFDGSRWNLWMELPTGKLQPLRVLDFSESVYLAKSPASSDDIRIVFLEWAIKRATPVGSNFRGAVQEDILNLCAAVAKLDLLHEHEWLNRETERMALTEIEYILVACRSLFDLLQEFISKTWGNVELLNPSTKKKDLPPKFREMILKSDQPRTPQDLEGAYGLPLNLGRYYESQSEFFLGLRKMRDSIVHHPGRAPIIFRLEEGFAVDVTAPPFSAFPGWEPDQLRNGRLGSLRRWVAHFVCNTLVACELFAVAVNACITFPPDFAPGYDVFLRSPNIGAIARLPEILYKDSWMPFVRVVGRHDRISQIANAIWEGEGRPHGRADAHWQTAERIFNGAQGAPLRRP